MRIGIFHKGWLLLETDSVTEAWIKARRYRKWYSGVEVKKIDDSIHGIR